MARFRRRSASSGDAAADESALTEEAGVEVGADELAADAELDEAAAGPSFDRSAGPFDESEADQADQELPRLDLGSLMIPGIEGIGVQVEADPSTQEVRAVTALGDKAAVQLQPFAAPRSEGLWDEIRAEMLAELSRTAGAEVSEGLGSFGPELRAILPARTPEGQEVRQPVRFVGIDGPRWFLRVVFLGNAAIDPDPEDSLHRVVRQTIVVRGGSAMPPRDPLPLTLPADATSAGPGDEAEVDDEVDDEGVPDGAEDRYADLNPFERGPEITETR
jgi:hypothetical protein